MADWSAPVLGTAYVSVLPDLKDRDLDAITLCIIDPTNIPLNAIKYNRATDKFQEWNGISWVDKVLSIAGGGTGATTAAGIRAALALGTMSVQNANAVAITGGAIAGAALNASDIVAGLVAQARLGSGATGAGDHFLADDQTYKVPVTIQTGTGFLWFTNAAPAGYALCDGSAISRATFATLFGIIGVVFGAGDGVTTFNLPDLRQRFPLGKAAAGTGNTLGATGGAIDHTHTGAAHTHTYTDVVNHTHVVNITDPGHSHTISEPARLLVEIDPGTALQFFLIKDSGGGAPGTNSNTTGITATTSNPAGGVATGTTNSTTPGAGGTNNPPFLVVNFIIKT